MNLFEKHLIFESEIFLKSSSNILENFSYDDNDNFKNSKIKKLPLMETLTKLDNKRQQNLLKRSDSPKFSKTIENNLFMKNVIDPNVVTTPAVSSPSTSTNQLSPSGLKKFKSFHDKEKNLRRSLEEISKDIKEIEDFITVTENIIRKERERDRELYARERRRKMEEKRNMKNHQKCSMTPNESSTTKKNGIPISAEIIKSPSSGQRKNDKGNTTKEKISSPTFKINSYKRKKPSLKSTSSLLSPRFTNSRLYFRNGKIGCVEAEQNNVSNIESTHALVKHILKYEKEKPLVSPESVKRVLNECKNEEKKKVGISNRKVEKVEINNKMENRENENVPETENRKANENVLVRKDNEKCELSVQEILKQNNEKEPNDIKNDVVLIDLEEFPESFTESYVPKHSEFVENIEPSHNEENQKNLDQIKENISIPNSASNDQLKVLDLDSQQFVRNQVRHLVRRFTARTNKMRTRLELPPTPSSSTSSPSPPPPPSLYDHHFNKQQSENEMTSVMKSTLESSEIASPTATLSGHASDGSVQQPNYFEANHQSINSGTLICAGLCGTSKHEGVLDPQGKIYISWLCIVSLSFLYNAWVIPLRSAFPFQTESNTNIWLIIDFCADLIYLFDAIYFKHRVMYLFEGFWVKDKNLTRKNYMRKLQFKLDILSLTPLDLFYFKYGTSAVYLRFPRLLKIQSFWEVFQLLDRVISSPHFVRVAKTLTYMLYMIHLTACAYYAYSAYQGLGTNRWVFNGKGHPYVRCFAFATKTATSIGKCFGDVRNSLANYISMFYFVLGKNPKPEKEGELLFMTAAWLMGVFVFALLIGQIRDIISTATRIQSEYRQLEDETLEYMRRLSLPNEIQRRIKMWFKFTWDQQRTLDESHILDSLPANLKTDIAISVHIQTLSKVQLFADCEEALLRELVLKLRSVTFLPGDYVCRKGEVGKEMYIVKLGQVQVMGGQNNDEVLATLSEGSVFGEISLLAINGEQGNRRTADVKSKGFSNLFVLSKNDLNEAIVYYPNAQAILKKRARSLIRKNAAREREEARKSALMKADVVIGNPQTPENPPKLLKTIMQALSEESPAVLLLTRGSKKFKKQNQETEGQLLQQQMNETNNEKNLSLSTNNTTDKRIFTFDNNVIRSDSPDLLSSIQDELKNKNKFINLTDSEKALIVSTNSLNNSNHLGDNENNNCD